MLRVLTYPIGVLSVAAVLLSFVAGCGSNTSTGQVHGKVTLDGKPLADGSIVTLPESGRGAQGIIKNGEFELGTTGRSDGAAIGKHKVAVISQEKSQAGPEGGAGKSLIPARYTNPDSSGLTIDVTAGTNTPTLELLTK